MTAEFLIEMAWKSSVIAGGALAFAHLIRGRSVAERDAAARLAILALLALPILSALLPALQVTAPATVYDRIPSVAPVAAPGGAVQPDAASTISLIALIAAAYAAGVATVAVRFLAGLWRLSDWTRRADPVTSAAWTSALARVGAARPRLLVSDRITAPMSWGWRSPVILLDPATLARTGDAEAVLAHEAAHVARRDWPMLVLGRIAVAVFWFNPLVWLLARDLVRHAEEAADGEAVTVVSPHAYAQALVSCARAGKPSFLPANAIAASGQELSRRVSAILEGRARRAGLGSVWIVAAVGASAALATPLAALEISARRATPVISRTSVDAALARDPAAQRSAPIVNTDAHGDWTVGGDDEVHFAADFDIAADAAADEAAAAADLAHDSLAIASDAREAARAWVGARGELAVLTREEAEAIESAVAAAVEARAATHAAVQAITRQERAAAYGEERGPGAALARRQAAIRRGDTAWLAADDAIGDAARAQADRARAEANRNRRAADAARAHAEVTGRAENNDPDDPV